MKQKTKFKIINGFYVFYRGDLFTKKQPKYKIIEIKKEYKNGK